MQFYDYEKMTEEQFETALQHRLYLQDGEREMGFWRKLLIALWVFVVVLAALSFIGITPAMSPNATMCGFLGILLIPAILVVDYHQYKERW